MESSDAKTVCILGRQPALGLAELESLYGSEHVRPLGDHALLDIPAEDIDFRLLGGTIKTARILTRVDTTDWRKLADYLIKRVPPFVMDMDGGKFTLGLSVYGLQTSVKQIEACLLEIKKQIRKSGRPARIVPNKELALNSAQVLHNKLTYKGSWELLFVKNGSQTLICQTLFVQDIEAYGARDQARPARDARVGMLPPKLAQIMVNLSAGPLRSSAPELSRIRVLDPFCGTGVILQEALLMGYSVMGTDIDERMVDFSKKNIRWLFEKYTSLEGGVDIEPADATDYRWPGFSAIASEVFLGRPLAALPPEDKLKQIISDADTVIKKFLRNLAPQLKEGRAICLAVPAWRKPGGGLIDLPVLAKLTEMGYNYLDLKHVRARDLVYFREDQVVARRLLRLKKA
jgi:tRNA (guanine10-N2)-dimethyltransferase